MPPVSSAKQPTLAWYERALRLLSVVLPFGLALVRATGSAQWRDDLPSLRDLGLLAVGVGGGVSTALTQALGLLPLGSRSFRAALGSVVALALCSYLVFGLARRLLRAMGTKAWLASVLASLATLSAALSPTWQREATVGGGSMIGVALALLSLTVATEERAPFRVAGARTAALFGALLGATFAESPQAAFAVIAAALAGPIAERIPVGQTRSSRPTPLPSKRLVALALALAAAVALLLEVPLFVRPLAPRAFADIGRALSAADLLGFDVAGPRLSTLAAWMREVGLVSMCIALAGAVVAFLSPRARPLIAPLLAFVALDTLMPAREFGALHADPLTTLRALAVLALSVSSSVGVSYVTHKLLELRLPLAKSGAVLLVVFNMTLVALASEEAGYVADRGKQVAAEEWTDDAMGRLEPNAAILVRSPAVAFRLWAARLLRGERPDVLIVPEKLVHRGRVALSLLAVEPEIEPLLRDYAIAGQPSEYALSKLADVRPLHVEGDRAWPKRLVSHLNVDGVWMEYAPQPLGPSDRKLSTESSLRPIRRVVAAIKAPLVPDAATTSVLSTSLRDQSTLLAMLGEYDAAQAFLDEESRLGPGIGSPHRGSVKQVFLAKATTVIASARSSYRPTTSARRSP